MEMKDLLGTIEEGESMTAETIIKMRTVFSDLPIQVTCDNLIVVVDNSLQQIVQWDDDNEVLTVLKINTVNPGIQDTYPFELLCTNYDHIQYMELLLPQNKAMEWVNNNKAMLEKETLNDENYYEIAKEFISKYNKPRRLY